MIGIYGGSFDPIHNGHLRAAIESCERLQLQNFIFVPCYQHAFNKDLQASSGQRLHMLQLAIADNANFLVDDIELKQQKISYSIETLMQLKLQYPDEKLAFIMGSDAFLQLPKWHRWQELLDYAHIVVLHRPGYDFKLTPELQAYFTDHQCTDTALLQHSDAHKIISLEIPLLKISSSYIRHQIAAGCSPRYLIPSAVNDYIKEQRIYTNSRDKH